MPSGSVLSRKAAAILSLRGSPRASATNFGPRAEPPMPMTRSDRNRAAPGGATLPACTSAAKAFTAASASRISAVSAGVGARSGARSQ